MDGHLALDAKFFDLPLEEKQKLDSKNEDLTRGYETMAAQVLDEGWPPDLKEGYMSSVDADENHRYTKLKVPGTGRNQWPETMPEFKVQYEAYVDHALDLGRHLARMLALSLELDEEYFDECLKEPLHYGRILKYPPHPQDAAQTSWARARIPIGGC
ncbi:MAG: isopenicillin N synthase-like dioxygenase [Paracoccaceae bacterium]|jgi:isopenicillin N synthase-like dioxygenase